MGQLGLLEFSLKSFKGLRKTGIEAAEEDTKLAHLKFTDAGRENDTSNLPLLHFVDHEHQVAEPVNVDLQLDIAEKEGISL